MRYLKIIIIVGVSMYILNMLYTAIVLGVFSK